MRAARYARVSTVEQATNTSILGQLELCAGYIAGQAWELAATFTEPGESGENLDRPAMTAARQAAQRGEFDVLVILTLDRLTRSLDDLFLLRREFQAASVRVYAVQDGQEVTSADTDDLLYVMLGGFFAQRERETIRRRTRQGTLRRVREGKYPGCPTPYGYHRDGSGHLQIEEQEAHVVRLMFNWLGSGQSAYKIAVRLNGLGVPSPRGGRWWPASVTAMVHNARYTGSWIYGRRGQNTPEIVVQLPEIVDQATWDRAQQVLQKNRSGGRPRKHRYLLAGLMRCACGATLYGQSPRRPGGPTRYRCLAKKDYRKLERDEPCQSVTFRAADLEDTLWAQIEQFVRQPHLVAAELGKSREPVGARLSEQLAETDRAIADRKAEIDRYLVLYGRGTVPVERLEARIEEVDEQIAALQAYRDSIVQEQRRADAWELQVGKLLDVLVALRDRLNDDASWDDRRYCIEHLVKSILIETGVDEAGRRYPIAHVTYRFEQPHPSSALIPAELSPLFSSVVAENWRTRLSVCDSSPPSPFEIEREVALCPTRPGRLTPKS